MIWRILNFNGLFKKSVYSRVKLSSSTSASHSESLSSSYSDSSGGSGSEEDEVDSLKYNLLHHSLKHVIKHGWSKEAISLGASDCQMSPMVHGLLNNGEFLLVDHFYKSANEELRDYLQERNKKLSQLSSPASSSSSPSSSPSSSSSSSSPSTAHLLQDALKFRLQLITPYIHVWPEAMALMSRPFNASRSVRNLAEMLDDVWWYAGDVSTDFSWYTKRATLACIYKSSELSLITDRSPNFEETWMFMERRFLDANLFTKCSKQASQVPSLIGSVLEVARNLTSTNNLHRD